MRIFVKAKPLSRKESVEKVDDSHYLVAVKEPPKDGKANQAIIRVLAKYFKIAPSRICLISGFSAKQKIFEVP
ncbi:MAG: hypothetical protein A3I89_02740 [Candidatus Harrisonbacteria bacterium RIFCSPLOWO2_02_FULL_41_11]|uniref:Uncharacterized protein n=1 Tax=Candidatus Harrisonbacteria bacterium RIFCSPHIGHO2_02_FULL_42_16 TaxID=1798404 RepID=A0A1G1ZJ82_9BACT|nr:MAG: hypothetical protein A3B92_00450 [Candidatus Harrisonbacteria bacterium RIFCSPHIGHO2_02_FULL_42_16]OGY66577.1 MAG: hypothetical protein A3I89_02740 [Candidatus Harrisonbacteria bacterium RIFCSPLOWO2_02_FULL_41_11]